MFKSDFGHLPKDDDDGTGEITNDPEYIRLWLLGIDDDGDPDGTHANKSSRDVRSHPNWNGPYIEYSTEKHLVENYEYEERDPVDHHLRWREDNLHYILVDAWDQRLYFETYDASVTSPQYAHRPIHNMDKWDVGSRGPDGYGTDDDVNSTGTDMSDFHGSYPERLDDYNGYEDPRSHHRVNRDNLGNW